MFDHYEERLGDISDDSQSFHSVDNQSLQELAKSSNSHSGVSLAMKKPPSYPYAEIQKLKESMKRSQFQLQHEDEKGEAEENSFTTAKEFESIAYHEGDSKYLEVVEASDKSHWPTNQSHEGALNKAIEMSHNSINDLSDQQYEGFDSSKLDLQIGPGNEKSVEISHIDQAEDRTQDFVDEEVLEITRQLSQLKEQQNGSDTKQKLKQLEEKVELLLSRQSASCRSSSGFKKAKAASDSFPSRTVQKLQAVGRPSLKEGVTKNFNISPKPKANSSTDSKKYKRFVFDYEGQRSSGREEITAWCPIHEDHLNPQPEYQIAYSFHLRMNRLVLRLNEVKSEKRQNGFKANYKCEYLIGTKDSQPSKQIVFDLEQAEYRLKSFTREVRVFTKVVEDGQAEVDHVDEFSFPNPLSVYMEPRFRNAAKTVRLPLNRMKNYCVNIETYADIESIQAMMSLWWMSSTDTTSYFSIKGHRAIFSVEFQQCTINESAESNEQNAARYSLRFRVSSSTQQEILVDLIEFITFMVVL